MYWKTGLPGIEGINAIVIVESKLLFLFLPLIIASPIIGWVIAQSVGNWLARYFGRKLSKQDEKQKNLDQKE